MKGLSDLPIAFFAALFGYLSSRNIEDHGWTKLFYYIAACGLSGAILHAIVISEPILSVFWIGLYYLMYESVYTFIMQVSRFVTGYDFSGARVFRIANLAAFSLSVILRFTIAEFAIYVFTAYSACVFIWLVYTCVQSGLVSKHIKASFLAIIFALVLLAFKSYIPGGVVYSHIVIVAALCCLYKLEK